MCLLIILLSGCHGVSQLERTTAEPPSPIMPYCLAATDPTELVLIAERFERVVSEGAEPLFWMTAWGDHVANQSLRASVDPQALGVACTIRTAAVTAEAERMTQARALYQPVLARYSNREWAYYVDRAKAALAGLQESTPAVVAFRPDPLCLADS